MAAPIDLPKVYRLAPVHENLGLHESKADIAYNLLPCETENSTGDKIPNFIIVVDAGSVWVSSIDFDNIFG